MTNEDRKIQYMNRNIKMYPKFLALIWDVLFVWTITTQFFYGEKHLSYSECMMIETILMFSACVMCIPVAKIFDKVSPIKSIRVGLVGYAMFLLLCIIGTNKFVIMCAPIFLAFGYCVVSVKGNPLLTDSLSVVKRDKDYNRIYGKGLSLSYMLEAIGAVVISYIYSIDPYLAFYISLGCVGIAFVFSFWFKEPTKFQEQNIELNPTAEDPAKQDKSKPKKKRSDSYLKILSSAFVISILLYSFMFRGVVSIDSGAFKIYLQELTDGGFMPLWAFGCVYGIMKLCIAISNKYQFKYNLKFGVRSLIIFNVLAVATLLINAVMYIISPTSTLTIVVIIISSCIMCSIRTPNFIFVNNYMQVCLPPRNLEKLYALSTVVQYLGYALMSAMYSGLLSAFGDDYGKSMLVYVIICIPLVIAATIFFIRQLTKKHAQKFTIIKPEYTED